MKYRFRKILLCLTLQVGALMGVPMRPDEIEELMRTMRETKIVRIIPDESDQGKQRLD